MYVSVDSIVTENKKSKRKPNPYQVAADTLYVESGSWKCPTSMTGAHYWKVNTMTSVCLCCGEKRETQYANYTPRKVFFR